MDILSSIIGMSTITTLVSFIMEHIRQYEIFKDLADIGYKIKINKSAHSGNSKKNHNHSIEIENLMLFIPFYNLAEVLYRYKSYYNNRNHIFEELNILGLIEEMTEEEKETYNKNRTILNALKIQIQSIKRMQESIIVILQDESKIWFEWSKKRENNILDEIKIIKVEGRASFLSKKEQKESILRVMDKFYMLIKLKYKSIDTSGRNIQLNSDKISKGIREAEIDRLLEELIKEQTNKEKIKTTNTQVAKITKDVSVNEESKNKIKAKRRIKKI